MPRQEEEGDQDDEKKQHQQEQNQEEFDFKSFRAKLEQNVDISSTSHIVVNLDDHFKQQKIKKLMDMQKKMEAANFLQSYKNSDLTVSKQVIKHISVAPAAAAGNDSVTYHLREKGNCDLSTIDSQQTRKMSESCVDDSGITDDDIHEKGLEEEIIDGTKDLVENNVTDDISNSNHGGIFCDSTHDKGLNEELLDVKIDGTNHLVDNELTGDVSSCIPFSENLLVPPKKNYPKMLLSCWCSDKSTT